MVDPTRAPLHALYEGTIRHRRFHPVENHFEYRLFLVFLDLARIDALSGIHPLWSGRGVNLAYFRRRDHTGDPRVPLDQAIRDRVQAATGHRPAGPVRMLTHLRYFGHCFNPVSFYYCYDVHDHSVETIVTEIHNTPWGEEHLYILPADQSRHASVEWRRHRFAKEFHVSPFMEMDIQYDWRFRLPGERLGVHMINYRNDKRIFDASLSLARRPLTRDNLTRALLLFPAMTAKVIFLIYWQALRLVVKEAPVHTHPKYET
ncbi:DUF1365 domain-containing protein [Desulfatitalea tepidiphila]|uniref:DUF1365 domain-containing protein n=1 Tax=Desulfatitalea tepidiphila TaxID=1185843 RepID=UPI0006B47399|nr:DUF1365 domain-containing protein [Desulfatitalea tepidiphila]